MVAEKINLSRGGVYLARLDPAKHVEIGKIRPVVILTAQAILNEEPALLFICPLSSQSHSTHRSLHLELPARDNLQVTSFALVEHARSISINRIILPRLAQLLPQELSEILHRLQRLIGI